MSSAAIPRVVSRLVREDAPAYFEGDYRPVRDAARAADIFRAFGLDDAPRERLAVLLLDARHAPTGVEVVGEGTLSMGLVHPREVFGAAVRRGAAALVLAHNHPSGDPEPSVEDLACARRLIACGEILGIPLLDSIVVGHERQVSLRDRMPWTTDSDTSTLTIT